MTARPEENRMETLSTEFRLAVRNVTISGKKEQRAIDAHTEVRKLLEADPELCGWGIDTRLIGSYARHTARYPGKDVDVILRFTRLSTSDDPGVVYDGAARVLIKKYGERDVDPGGRVTKQPRSLKVAFTDPDQPDSDLSFSIDAVPAVPWGDHWGIPNRDTDRWQDPDPAIRWVLTSPIQFADDSETLSTSESSPTVGGDNAYCPVVRLLRQVRHVHLGEDRPGGLYTEVAAYHAWQQNAVRGDSWAQLLAESLRQVASQFRTAATAGMTDPVLGTAMKPELTREQWTNAADVFERLAVQADEALGSDRCRAAYLWRQILGENDLGPVLPLPSGCDANGMPLAAAASVAYTGSDEPRGFA
jgi:hypothetical protein